MRRASLVTALAFCLAALAAGPASAQYPPAAPDVGVSLTVVTPGATITVTGSGWLPGAEVTITFLSDPVLLGTATVDANGTFTTQVTIPADASPGAHTLRVTGIGANGQPRTVDQRIVVAAADADRMPVVPVPAPILPRTGEATLLSLLAAGGLLGVGTAAVIVARRRDRTEARV